MTSHLLGKKSWNVYNIANIEKVKKDEEAAAAREAAEEQRMQEVDAERRVQTLRGLRADPLPAVSENASSRTGRREHKDVSGRDRKRRKIEGENVTDREIRYVQETQLVKSANEGGNLRRRKTSDAPLTDPAGHINLFPTEGAQRNGPKNPEAEAEAAVKKREYEDQYTMRFSNAAGFKQAIDQKPWYHCMTGPEKESEEVVSKDVWGKEDPRRKERQQMRAAADDPLAIIHRGVQDLRQVEKQRKRWLEERQHEMEELAKADRRRAKKRKVLHDDIPEHIDFNEQRSRHEHRPHHSYSKEHTHRRRSRDRNKDKRHSNRRSSKPKGTIGWEAGPGGRYSSQFADVKS